MVLEFQLQCGHRATKRQWPDEAEFCPQCDAMVRLWAVECREYKVGCVKCSFARWCGASKELAHTTEAGHALRTGHEQFILDYLQVPDKAKKCSQLYPKIHRNILDSRELPNHPARWKILPDEPPF